MEQFRCASGGQWDLAPSGLLFIDTWYPILAYSVLSALFDMLNIITETCCVKNTAAVELKKTHRRLIQSFPFAQSTRRRTTLAEILCKVRNLFLAETKSSQANGAVPLAGHFGFAMSTRKNMIPSLPRKEVPQGLHKKASMDPTYQARSFVGAGVCSSVCAPPRSVSSARCAGTSSSTRDDIYSTYTAKPSWIFAPRTS